MDEDVIARIDALVAEEHRLHEGSAADGFADTDRDRLQHLEAQLDQCWDLLRQRRARRHAGEDPGDAEVRPVEVVEHYQQ